MAFAEDQDVIQTVAPERSRCGAIASRPDDFSHTCALSMFSNSVTPKRLGGSPITAVILSVGPVAANPMAAGRLHC